MTSVIERSIFGDSASSGHASSPADSSNTSLSASDEETVVIAAHGDLVLRIEHEARSLKQSASFRVNSSALKQHSKYFERLLQAGRFGEGASVEAQHKTLREQYPSMMDAPTSALPVVKVEDLGRISTVKSLTSLCTDLLYILHGKDTNTFPPIANLSNLAIVADRFDALDVVRGYVRRKKMVRAIDGKTTGKADVALSDERVRQRLLVAIMLDYPFWVEKYSARLITKGWVGEEVDVSAPLWWDLPSRFEEELAYRRECILQTVQSLQSHFLSLYTSRERQCKLGYDSSAQCDSFQLGEMIRFFTRTGTLQLQGSIYDRDEPLEAFPGDIYSLLDTLRQVPEYQIDRNHTHCGLRTRMVPLLDLIQDALQYVGVCPECWAEDRSRYAWMDAKRPLLWERSNARLRGQGHGNRHPDVRAFFTAGERQWAS